MTPLKAKETQTVTEPVDRAFRWLRDSGIQIRSDQPSKEGGVASWYDLDRKSYPFIYAEITGYAVNAFLFQYRSTGDGTYKASAIRAGDWLLNNRCPLTGLVQTRYWLDDSKAPYFDQCFFMFDQWIIVYGLACLAEVTREARFLNGAVSIAKFLLGKTVREDGFFYPLFDSAQNRAVEFGDKWSRQAGSFHAKALMALAKLLALTGESCYRESADRLLAKTLSVQMADGRFVTQDNEGSTHLHPFLYTLEGLASYALSQKKKDLLKAVERGVRWILERQNSDGSVFCFFKDGQFKPFVRADVLSQTLRIASIVMQQGLLAGHSMALDKLRSKLETYQVSGGAQDGGFMYGQEENGSSHAHVNAWVTMFASQSLWVHDGLRGARSSYDMAFFV